MANTVTWYGRRFERVVNTSLGRAMANIGMMQAAHVKRSMVSAPSTPGGPPAVITGSYVRSIGWAVKRSLLKRTFTARVGTNDKRGPWLELGTGSRAEGGGSPYLIKAKGGGTLRFIGRDGGVVFAKSVMHPGIYPRPHFRPALYVTGKIALSILQSAARGKL